MKYIKSLINIILLWGVILTSCNDNEMAEPTLDETSTLKSVTPYIVGGGEIDQKTVIGPKLPNAYSLANMRNAYTVMAQKGIASQTLNIQANNIYVRFLPTTLEQYELLTNILKLELFDFPLDYKIISVGSHYRDPSLPSSNPYTWQYTTVPANFVFPKVPYEILDQLFFPDEYFATPGQTNSTAMDQFLIDLEAESMLQTKLITEEQYTLAKSPTRGRKIPEGDIKVRDTKTGTDVGVSGIKVRIFSGVRFDHAFTNTNGHYKMSKKILWDPWYCVKCEHLTGARIFDNLSVFDEAKYSMGQHSNSGWSFTAQTNSCSWKWFTVNNALGSYREFCDSYPVTKPPLDLRIWVDEKNFDANTTGTNGSASMMYRTYGIVGFSTNSDVANFFLNIGIVIPNTVLFNMCKFLQPDITIGVDSDVAGTLNLSATVFHELAHASHWAKVGSSYWIKYINYIITYGAYGNGTGNNAGICGVGEIWGNYFGNYVLPKSKYGVYSGGWDDSENWYNPGVLMYSKNNCPDLTISKIYSCLGATSISNLKANLKNQTIYDSKIDEAFASYYDWP